jgi:dTDP-glucose 4,6-dehydratase
VPGEIYNIGGGLELSNLNLTRKLLLLADRDESSIEYVQDRLGHDRRYSVNYSKIVQIGYLPDKNFEGNLKSTFSWYAKDYINVKNESF